MKTMMPFLPKYRRTSLLKTHWTARMLSKLPISMLGSSGLLSKAIYPTHRFVQLFGPSCLHSGSFHSRPATFLSPELGHKEENPEKVANKPPTLKRISQFTLKADRVFDLLDRGDTEGAVEEFSQLLGFYQKDPDSSKVLGYLIHSFLINPTLGKNDTSCKHLLLFAENNFFIKSCKSKDVWSRVISDTRSFGIKERLFEHWDSFGMPFTNLIHAITSTMFQKPGENAILEILEQIPPKHKAHAYRATLSCFTVASVPPVYTSFALQLFETMREQHLALSADACGVVIDRFLSRLSVNSPLIDKYLPTIVDIYRKSKASVGFLGQPVTTSLCVELCKAASPRYGDALVEVVFDLIESRSKFSAGLSRSVLSALAEITQPPSLAQLKQNPTQEWTSSAIAALWNALKVSSLDHEKCLCILLHCFSKATKNPGSCSDTIKQLLDKYTGECLPNSTKPIAYFHSALAVLGQSPNLPYTMSHLKDSLVTPDVYFLNTLMYHYNLTGNQACALESLNAITAMYPEIVPDSETLALVFESHSKACSYSLAKQSCETFFERFARTPCQQRVYHCILAGLNEMLLVKPPSPLFDQETAAWAVKQLDRMVSHMHVTSYAGPVAFLHQMIVKGYANFLRGARTFPLTNKAYAKMVSKFFLLVQGNFVSADPSLYVSVFGAMATAADYVPSKRSAILRDFDQLYAYMMASKTKLSPSVFSAMFTLATSARDVERPVKLFYHYQYLCRSRTLAEPGQMTLAFNAYITGARIPLKGMVGFLNNMVALGARPDEHTFIHLLKGLVRQSATFEDLNDCLVLIKGYFALKNTDLFTPRLEVSIKLLSTVAHVFFHAGGPREMTSAVEYLLRISSEYHRLRHIPLEFYLKLIELALLPSNGNRGEEAIHWFKRMSNISDATRNEAVLSSARQLFNSADPTVKTKFSPDFLAHLNGIRHTNNIPHIG